MTRPILNIADVPLEPRPAASATTGGRSGSGCVLSQISDEPLSFSSREGCVPFARSALGIRRQFATCRGASGLAPRAGGNGSD